MSPLELAQHYTKHGSLPEGIEESAAIEMLISGLDGAPRVLKALSVALLEFDALEGS